MKHIKKNKEPEAFTKWVKKNPKKSWDEFVKKSGEIKNILNDALLKEQGYLTQETYGSIHLTDSGRELGKKIFDRHKVIMRYLIDILNVSEEVAEEDACKMEHILHEETFNKMKNAIEK